MDARSQLPVTQEQISLKEVLEVFWRGKWRALCLSAALVGLALLAAWALPNKYQATVLVAPVTNTPGGSGMGALSSVVSQFSGLASLAGLSVAADTHRAETIAVLQSRALTEQYIKENNLLPVLFAKAWDAKTGRWKAQDPRKAPTLWTGEQYFKSRVSTVTENPKTGLVTLQITWKDPELAAAWANGLVKATNDYLRAKAIAEAQANIDYLEQQAAKTDVVGVRQAIYSILENEIDKEMLARGSEQYALKVLDPALPPERPSSPKPLMWSLLALFCGIVLSLFVAFVKVAWRGP